MHFDSDFTLYFYVHVSQRLINIFTGTHKGGFFPAENAAEEKTTHNHHASEKLKEYYTPAAVEMVKKMYKADFETFGYSDASPLL